MINIHMKGHSVDRVEIDGVPVQSCVHEYGKRGGCQMYSRCAGIHTVAVPFSLEFLRGVNKGYEERGYAPPFDADDLTACAEQIRSSITNWAKICESIKPKEKSNDT